MKFKNQIIVIASLLMFIAINTSHVESALFKCDDIHQDSWWNFNLHKDLQWNYNSNYDTTSNQYITWSKWVYYCFGQYILTWADSKSFEVISPSIAKDKNRIYFTNTKTPSPYYSLYTIVSNNKPMNMSSLKMLPELGDGVDYYAYGNSTFMINQIQLGAQYDYNFKYFLIPLKLSSSEIIQGTSKWSLIAYWAPIVWAKLPISLDQIMWKQCTVEDWSWSIRRYKDRNNKVIICDLELLKYYGGISSTSIWSRQLEPKIRKIDEHVIQDSWMFYIWGYSEYWLINNIDHQSFVSLWSGDRDQWYYKDKNRVYYVSFQWDWNGPQKNSGGNLKDITFNLISLDKNLDIASFQLAWWGFAKDKNNIYLWLSIWTGDWKRDVISFKSVEPYNWRYIWYGDKDRFYYVDFNWSSNTYFTWINVDNVKLIPIIWSIGSYWTNWSDVYYSNVLQIGMDGRTLVPLDGLFVADKNWVYYGEYGNQVVTWVSWLWAEKIWFISSYGSILKNNEGIYLLYRGNDKPPIKLPIDKENYKIFKWDDDLVVIEDSTYTCSDKIYYSMSTKNTKTLRRNWCIEKNKK